MRKSKSIWCAAALAAALATGLANAAENKDQREKQPGKARQTQPQRPQRPEAQSPKAQQARPSEAPKAPPAPVHPSPPPKVQPQQQAERPQAPKAASEHPVQPKLEKSQAHPVTDRPDNHQPEKSPPLRSANRPLKSEPEKIPSHDQADHSSLPKSKGRDVPIAPQPQKDKPVQVHARQPSNTLKPEQTPLVRPAPPPFKLTEVKKSGGAIERVSPSNKVRERTTVDKKAGQQRTEQLGVTGRVEVEEVKRKDGTRQLTQYDLGREKKTQVVRKDGSIETTDIHYNRNGEQRARETIVRNASGRAVSKTVVVQPSLVVRNTTVVYNNTTIVRHYSPCRYGFVYQPAVFRPVVFASWYDPYWYSPAGYVVYHPFRYSWTWYHEPWFSCHVYYWNPYPVYPAPCYWLTDWLVACYIADRYAAAASAEQAREEVRLAREEAEKARIAAEQARNAAEIAEARAAVAAAEARAERAEARAAKAELEEAKAKELAGKPNPKATPIDKETKDALKDQVEKTIAEKKQFAEQSAKGADPAPRDVTASLADPKHIFPVSKTISVIRAEDSKPAGILTAGDLLRAEPGQEKLLAEANENTPITMRVITSKGEDESVPAGTLVAIPLSELQEFDNEFRAKVDLGLTEANNNKDQFKKEAVN